MGCTTADVAAAVRAMAAVVAAHRDELVDLDRAIGDGDHGENLKRGFEAVVSALDSSEVDSPADVLKLVAKTLGEMKVVSSVPSALKRATVVRTSCPCGT